MDALLKVIKRYWGYSTLRPLQLEAMAAAVRHQDSLAIMPTGGGKSLCYQAPALLADELTVVISPLIALMKDQVDALLARDIPAAFVNSSLDAADYRRVSRGIDSGEYKLLFVAPERFKNDRFRGQLGRARIGSFAIDEAHCISHWGHDFRVDYRQLGLLKEQYPQASVHAFTATATPRVRDDIVAQLGLKEPTLLVGDFFRPNLNYQVRKRGNATDDILDELKRRPGQAGIVYCIRRADVDGLAGVLKSARIRARGYHAGMDDQERTATQDAFAAGEVDVIVATVAFGMGIDRSDIRFVIHAAMPKSIEHYQQETGRAGRDGKPADCVLLYSGSDFRLWESIIGKEASPNQQDQLALLSEMSRYCQGASCRHKRLVTYFGQSWERDNCGACDICTDGHEGMPESTVTAQKIMSCIVRTGQRYGAAYVAEVLRGEASDRVLQRGHNELSTFGLMPEHAKGALMTWMDQLADQGLLEREGEYRVLKVTHQGWAVLKGESEARLLDVSGKPRKSKTARKSPDGRQKRGSKATVSSDASGIPVVVSKRSEIAEPLDPAGRRLYEQLKILRRQIADDEGVPAFMVCSDKTLRDMARRRPVSRTQMLEVYGMGEVRFEHVGHRFIQAIQEHAG